MNVATSIPSARFSAVLVEGDKLVGLEDKLRDESCNVLRASSRASAIDAIQRGADLIVIAPSTLGGEDVAEIIAKANGASILVIAQDNDLAVRAAKLGASVMVGSSIDLAAAQIKQLLAVVDLKRKVARQTTITAMPSSAPSPMSGVVQRRSAPLPKEATPDALDALVEAAEGLVPMHKFQRVYVDYALRRFGGNKVHTAAALGIDRRTIQRWARARAEQRPAAPVATGTTSTTQS